MLPGLGRHFIVKTDENRVICLKSDPKIMLSGDELLRIKNENELVKVQLGDLDYMIQVREEELEMLRKKALEAIELKSMLDNRLLELEQLQNNLLDYRRREDGSINRERVTEEEILLSINIEKEYYVLREKLISTRSELEYVQSELADKKDLHSKIEELEKNVATLESKLGMAEHERDAFKEELELIKIRQSGALRTAI